MKRNKILGRYCIGFLIVLGSVFIILGLILQLYFTQLYDFVIYSALDISPNSPAYEAWKTNDPPLIVDFYFFNWTNAKDVYRKDVKPRFEQVGPYRFYEIKEKYDIVFHDNNSTVSYKTYKKYYFMGEDSPKQLDEVINTINSVALSAAYKSRFLTSFKRTLFSWSLSSTSSIYVTKSIDELLFAGYEDKLLNIVSALSPFLAEGNINDKFGYFYNRNFTLGLSGDLSIYTSHDDKFGKLATWDFRNRTDFFEGRCGEIRGSAGEFYTLNRKRDSVELFSNEMCITAQLFYEKDVDVKGAKAYKFSANALFDNGLIALPYTNEISFGARRKEVPKPIEVVEALTGRGTKYPENSCFCNGECIPYGVLNISSCRMGAPFFLSLPHFYDADPYYTDIIDGMEPSKEKHDFYMSMEPKSSIVLDVAGRMQLNVLLQPLEGISLYTNVPKVFVPIFYFDQVVTLSDDIIYGIKMLQNLPEMAERAVYIFLAIGLVIFIIVVANCLCPKKKLKSKKNEYKIPQTTITMEEVPLRKKNEAQ